MPRLANGNRAELGKNLRYSLVAHVYLTLYLAAQLGACETTAIVFIQSRTEDNIGCHSRAVCQVKITLLLHFNHCD